MSQEMPGNLLFCVLKPSFSKRKFEQNERMDSCQGRKGKGDKEEKRKEVKSKERKNYQR